MPNIKSQKDRVVQAKKEALHNKVIKSNLKTVIKKADAAIDSNAADKDAAIKAQTLPSTATLLTKTPPSRPPSLPLILPRARVSSTRTPLPARSAAWPSVPTKLPRSNDRMNNARRVSGGHFHLQGSVLVAAFANQRAQQRKHQAGRNAA